VQLLHIERDERHRALHRELDQERDRQQRRQLADDEQVAQPFQNARLRLLRRGGTVEFLADEQPRDRRSEEEQRTRDIEDRAVAEAIRQQPAEERAENGPGGSSGLQRAHREAHLLLGRSRRDEGDGRRHEAGDNAVQHSQREQMPWRRRKAHQHHDDRHSEARAQQHHFTPVLVRQLGPQGLEQERGDEIRREYETRPDADFVFVGQAQVVLQIQGEKRDDHRHPRQHEKIAAHENDQIDFPALQRVHLLRTFWV